MRHEDIMEREGRAWCETLEVLSRLHSLCEAEYEYLLSDNRSESAKMAWRDMKDISRLLRTAEERVDFFRKVTPEGK